MAKACNHGSCLKYALPGKARCADHQRRVYAPIAKRKAAKRAQALGDGAARRLRQQVNSLDAYNLVCCALCGGAFPPQSLEVDHKLPLRDGGTDYDLNVWLLCRSCHSGKTMQEAIARAKRKKITI